MINSVFGKTMENLRKRVSVNLVNNGRDYLNYVSRPTFVSQKIFDRNFVAIHRIKTVLLLNKPIYVGFSILELSKLLMYDFHYNYFKKSYDVKLLLTDTDSLFDFSDYLKSSKFYDASNKKIIGKMKDEMRGEVISEFVGLKSKMYSLVSVDGEEKIRAKGVNVKVRHNEFFDVLFNKNLVRHNMKRIQSKHHRLGTYDVYKRSLSCFDDKRYMLGNGIDTLAYFHKDTRNDC